MTRGRHSNTALVVTDRLDLEHAPEPATAQDLLVSALGRVSAERSATEELRQLLASSESLAVLKPRLANLDAQISQERPPDHTIELQRLAHERNRLEQHPQPGRLTRARRDHLRRLRVLDQRQADLEAAQQARLDWMDAHQNTFEYRRALAEQIAGRRSVLGLTAATERPEHLVDLLGQVPADHSDRAQWVREAGRIEAYREEWGIEPDQLHVPSRDHVQYEQWDLAVKTIQILNRLDSLQTEHSLEVGLEQGLGLEL